MLFLTSITKFSHFP